MSSGSDPFVGCMSKTGMCRACGRVVRLTSKGVLATHGYRRRAMNRLGLTGFRMESNFEMERVRPPCWGSGKTPKSREDIEHERKCRQAGVQYLQPVPPRQ